MFASSSSTTRAYYFDEYHIDGLRYDEISALLNLNPGTGFSFCQDITNTVRWKRPRSLQNAEHWPVASEITEAPPQGAGFDVIQHDGLRISLRNAIAQASHGGGALPQLCRPSPRTSTPTPSRRPGRPSPASKIMTSSRTAPISGLRDWLTYPMRAPGMRAAGRALHRRCCCFRPASRRFSWARSFWRRSSGARSELPASYLVGRLKLGRSSMVDHLRFMRDAIGARWTHPALRGSAARPFYVNETDRVIAIHRWLEGSGRDVVVVASLSDTTYAITNRLSARRTLVRSLQLRCLRSLGQPLGCRQRRRDRRRRRCPSRLSGIGRIGHSRQRRAVVYARRRRPGSGSDAAVPSHGSRSGISLDAQIRNPDPGTSPKRVG